MNATPHVMKRIYRKILVIAMLFWLTEPLVQAQPTLAESLRKPGRLTLGGHVGQADISPQRLTVAAKLAQAARSTFVQRFNDVRVEGSQTSIRVQGKHTYWLYLHEFEGLPENEVMELSFPVSPDTRVMGYEVPDVFVGTDKDHQQRLRILYAPSSSVLGLQNGGPAMVANEAEGQASIIFPISGASAKVISMLVEDYRDTPTTRWSNDGTALYVEWHDQVDTFTFAVDDQAVTTFVLERSQGEHSQEIVSFGLEPKMEEAKTGELIGAWNMDRLVRNQFADQSTYGHPITVHGDVQHMPGLRGQGIYGASSSGVPKGTLIVPDDENKVPGTVSFGKLTLPAEVLDPIENAMTLSFWYAQPAFASKAYQGYLPLVKDLNQSVFKAEGFLDIYNSFHWSKGQMITAEGLGNHRLFGLYGPEPIRDMWSFYTFVIDGKTAQMYINGELRVEVEGKFPLAEAKRAFTEVVLMENMWGTIDEVKLYDYAFTIPMIKDEFLTGQAAEMLHLNFETDIQATAEGLSVRDAYGNLHHGMGFELVDGPVGKAIKFSKNGGQISLSHAINQGKNIQEFTYASWIKFPANYKDRSVFFDTHTGHAGIGIYLWGSRLWGRSAQNVFESETKLGEWNHVIVAYSSLDNRLTTWVNGQQAFDSSEAFPTAKGFNVSTLPYDLGSKYPIELDEVRLFNFYPDAAGVAALYAGKPVPVPTAGKRISRSQKTVVRAGVPSVK